MSASFLDAMELRAEDTFPEEFDEVSDEDSDDDDGPGVHISRPAFNNLVLNCYSPVEIAMSLSVYERYPGCGCQVVVDPGAEEAMELARGLMAAKAANDFEAFVAVFEKAIFVDGVCDADYQAFLEYARETMAAMPVSA